MQFVLKNIDIEKIIDTYGLKYRGKKINGVTSVDELDVVDGYQYSYLDEQKISHECVISMQNYITRNRLPISTNIECFWCRGQFNTIPLGCPIEYIESKVTKSYYSEITKNKLVIKESLSSMKRKELHDVLIENGKKLDCCDNVIRGKLVTKVDGKNIEIEIKLEENEYYLVDGIFCSFNCCMAFIDENIHDYLYRNSRTFLIGMYNKIYSSNVSEIIPAPSWRLKKKCAGHMTDEEYREKFNNVFYKDTGDIVMCPVAMLYETRSKI